MRWRVTIPGNAVSLDSAYRTGRMAVFRRGVPVLNEDGTRKMIHRPVLDSKAERWRDDCQLLMQNAMPRSFQPTEKIRIRWKFYLTRIIDSDNLIKLPSDALQRATGINDSRFLHCIEDVIVVSDPREARVEVVIDSDPACCFSLLDEGRDPHR